ncbi:MAG: peptide deformylase [Bacteroidota bacterium]
MTYPIVAYGDPVLRKRAVNIEQGTDVKHLAAAMLATMAQARGVGLAAPQIGKAISLFVVDLSPFMEAKLQSSKYRKVYINPTLQLDSAGILQYHEEGCLSIPDISVEVPRAKRLVVTYFDTNWQRQEEELTDMPARVIQHEYDHLNGKLHIDYASPLKRRLLKGKLADISQGKVAVAYKMRFPG